MGKVIKGKAGASTNALQKKAINAPQGEKHNFSAPIGKGAAKGKRPSIKKNM